MTAASLLVGHLGKSMLCFIEMVNGNNISVEKVDRSTRLKTVPCPLELIAAGIRLS